MDRRSIIKVDCKRPCPEKAVEEFNIRIAEIIASKFSKDYIEKVISEYEKAAEEIR